MLPNRTLPCPLTLSEELQSWVGRTRVVEEDISLGAVRRIAGMLDFDPDELPPRRLLPPHWFTLFFNDTPRQSDIGPDGHPKPGVVLPPIPLPRRMGAGRRVSIPGQLRIGDVAVKTAEVAAILPKQARTGFITVLTMRHTLRVGDAVVAVDEFDAVYREAVKPGEKSTVAPPAPAPAGAGLDGGEASEFATGVPLFRGDLECPPHPLRCGLRAAEEGYPNTVQNGGLTMQLLLDAAVAHTPGRLTGFSARLTRPIYVGDTITLAGQAPQGGKVLAWVQDRDGNLCAQLDCEFADGRWTIEGVRGRRPDHRGGRADLHPHAGRPGRRGDQGGSAGRRYPALPRRRVALARHVRQVHQLQPQQARHRRWTSSSRRGSRR